MVGPVRRARGKWRCATLARDSFLRRKRERRHPTDFWCCVRWYDACKESHRLATEQFKAEWSARADQTAARNDAGLAEYTVHPIRGGGGFLVCHQGKYLAKLPHDIIGFLEGKALTPHGAREKRDADVLSHCWSKKELPAGSVLVPSKYGPGYSIMSEDGHSTYADQALGDYLIKHGIKAEEKPTTE